MSLPQFSDNGLDYDSANDRYVTKQLDYSLPAHASNSQPTGSGEPMSQAAAKKMIDTYLGSLTNPSSNDPVVAVTYSKEVILRLLAQSGCEGIKFYFGTDENGDLTLVLTGVDSSNKDLGASSGNIADSGGSGSSTAQSALIYQRAGPKIRYRDMP